MHNMNYQLCQITHIEWGCDITSWQLKKEKEKI